MSDFVRMLKIIPMMLIVMCFMIIMLVAMPLMYALTLLGYDPDVQEEKKYKR